MATMPDSVLSRAFLDAEVFKASLPEDGHRDESAAPADSARASVAAARSTAPGRPGPGAAHDGSNDWTEARARQRAFLARVWLKSDLTGIATGRSGGVLDATRKLLNQLSLPRTLSPREQILAELLRKELDEAASAAHVQQLLPPAMIYLSPLRLDGLKFAVPDWLREDVFRYRLARPSYFEEPGEVDAYRDYLLRLTEEIHAEIQADPQSPGVVS